MPYALMTPGRSVIGDGAMEAAERDIAALGKKALIVTGKTIQKGTAFTALTALLGKLGIGYAVFSDIPSEPDDAMVEAGVQAYKAAECDCLIGIGGGSPLDCAKAIAVGVVAPGSVCAHAGKDIAFPLPPFALIPTTAGTGSEATRFTVITDRMGGAKLLLRGDVLLPRLAIVDFNFTLSAPPQLTGYTGIDALTHAVEAYTSRKATPLSDPFVSDAARRIFKSLPLAFADGEDRAARESLAIAAYEAGVGISNASVTLVHGMSRPIGAHFHVPHGLSNAMLIEPCLRYAAEGRAERFASLARLIGLASQNATDRSAADALIDKIAWIVKVLHIPTLAEYGVQEGDFTAMIPRMAKEALASGSPANTQREVTETDIVRLYENLY